MPQAVHRVDGFLYKMYRHTAVLSFTPESMIRHRYKSPLDLSACPCRLGLPADVEGGGGDTKPFVRTPCPSGYAASSIPECAGHDIDTC
jgi:hypothetical protein